VFFIASVWQVALTNGIDGRAWWESSECPDVGIC
jgi:hypothetical protein